MSSGIFFNVSDYFVTNTASVQNDNQVMRIVMKVIMDMDWMEDQQLLQASAGVGKAIAQVLSVRCQCCDCGATQPRTSGAEIVSACATIPDCQSKIKAISADIRVAENAPGNGLRAGRI